jgi:hypothetical protein
MTQRFQVAFAFNKHISGTPSHAVSITGANICRPTVKNINCNPLIYYMVEDPCQCTATKYSDITNHKLYLLHYITIHDEVY